MSWVQDYLFLQHGKARALEIIEDIDRRYAQIYLH